MLELELEPADVGLEHADRLLEQLLAGLVAVRDDDPQRIAHGGGDFLAVQLELVGALLERRDDERDVLVEVDPERLGARPQLLAVDRGGERGRLHLLLDGLGGEPVDALRAHVGAGHHEARELVDRVQRLLEQRVARDAEEVRVRGDRAHELGVGVTALELGERLARVARSRGPG